MAHTVEIFEGYFLGSSRSSMALIAYVFYCFFFFQAEDGIRDGHVTGVQTCALPISVRRREIVEGESESPARDEPFAGATFSGPGSLLQNLRRRLVWTNRVEMRSADRRSEERRVGKEGRSRGATDS